MPSVMEAGSTSGHIWTHFVKKTSVPRIECTNGVHLASCNMGAAQNSRARGMQVLVVGSIYPGAMFGTFI